MIFLAKNSPNPTTVSQALQHLPVHSLGSGVFRLFNAIPAKVKHNDTCPDATLGQVLPACGLFVKAQALNLLPSALLQSHRYNKLSIKRQKLSLVSFFPFGESLHLFISRYIPIHHYPIPNAKGTCPKKCKPA